jgi:carbon-monoxide dehydrogenase medium subunit
MPRFAYLRPRTLAEAFGLGQAEPEARWIAGGTDVMVQVRRGPAPPALVSLAAIPELSGVSIDARGGARIGALTTFAELLQHPLLAARWPVLAQAAGAVGSVQIRNRATIGGNLANASPCADSAGALLVLGARLRLAGPGGARELPIDDFFLGPGRSAMAAGEILTDILLDPPAPGSRGAFRKQGRVHMDLALASLALHGVADGDTVRWVRLAAGSVAPVPLRLRRVEDLLAGRRADPDLIAEAGRVAAAEIAPIDDVRATAAYRRALVEVFVRRGLKELCA